MSRFKGLSVARDKVATPPVEAAEDAPEPDKPVRGKAKARQGKHGIMGYFSADLMRAMRLLAAEEDKTIQALLGEAIDLLMRDRGKHPFGEK